VALIKRLVDAGADVNAVDEDDVFAKRTALHYAARRRQRGRDPVSRERV
jgi:hypothetical protein